MKTQILFIALFFSALLFSCEKIKDATAVDIETELNASFPISAQNEMAINLKSAEMANDVYAFNGSGTFSLADNNDIKKYIGNIRDIIANEGGVVTFLGAVDGNKILTCKLLFGAETTSGTDPAMTTAFTLPQEILADAGKIEYFSDSWTSIFINALEANKDKTFRLKIEGTANYDINTTVRVKVPVTVKASPL
ncbi:MAG TPA: hypothetical protein ENN90_06235 [Mariniphaga anaerophila]|uniref:DUF4840 domain-containing protein n=1 Tax=Mariniphaga anaerophila TaxID=1484053 RepID=A0A831LGU4_9BACT|nr:hypothetical protein [Mariniphaga anaerophila]